MHNDKKFNVSNVNLKIAKTLNMKVSEFIALGE